jgi:hypothetical protein
MVEVLRALDRRRLDAPGRFAQTVIFTRFYDTLTDIVERLLQAAPDMRLGTYSGRGGQYLEPGTNQLVAVDRDEVRHRFLRQDIDILVCTDAAAEGLNLQTADLLVNFDLPWNPMKVEQRIGRIDRIGQVHDRIYVLNLCYTDSAEQIVYGRLLQRLTQAGLIVGTQQLSLLPVTRDEFQSLAEGTLTATEVERLATERARRARRRMESMAIPPQELHRTYVRLEQQQHHKQAPVELDFIWETLSQSAYLHALGCQVQADSTKRLLTLDNIPDLPKGTALTASRATYEQGATELQGPLHFATYGDAAFEAVLDQLARFDLPACIRRLAVDIPDIPVTVIGYAIACKNGRGNVECRLVTSMRELDHLELHTEAHLTDAEVHPLRQSLSALGRQAYETTLNAQRIETLNEAAGESQQALNDLVMRGIILSRQRTGRSAPLIWRELGELEDLLQNPKTRLRVRHIPNEAARVLSGLLFDLTIPNTGEESHLDALWPLGLSALESAYRRASAMKGKRSELSTDDFLTRLSRAISGNAL